VLAVPDEIEREVAALKLAALDVDIDQLTDAQAKYLSLTSRQRDR
jgi:adenosylhomocysteinase